MAVARVTEISSRSEESFEAAINEGIERANKTLRNVRSAWIKEQSVAFASAAVPTVQANIADKIYLSSFTPLNNASVWPGRLDAFLKPLPIDPDTGFPDRSTFCDQGTVDAECFAFDAGDSQPGWDGDGGYVPRGLLLQAPLLADNAAAVAGDWAVAPAPQWEEGATVSANNGGSQLLVLEGTEHAKETLEFANWLNTNVEGLSDLGLFPATATADLTTPANVSAFFGGQDVYAELTAAAGNVETQWLFPPVYTTIGKALGDGIAEVRNGTITLPDLLDRIQDDSLAAFEDAGINATAE